MTTLARCAFATLALNAKVHGLLDRVGERQSKRYNETRTRFEGHLGRTVDALASSERESSATHRRRTLQELRSELRSLDNSYREYKSHHELEASQSERFDALIALLKLKLKQKEDSL